MASKLSTSFIPLKPFSWLFQLVLMIIVIILSYGTIITAENGTTNIGAIIDADSRAGKEQKTALTIAVETFNRKSETHKLAIHFKNSSGDPLQAASSAEELIKEREVQVIIGMNTWEEAALVANIGQRAQIPVISFSAADITPSIAQLRWPFLVQMSNHDSDEISCIAAMVRSYNWRRVIVIYDDNLYGGESHNLAPLSEALQKVGSEIEHRLMLPPLSASSGFKEIIHEEVAEVLKKQSRVFIVLQSSLPMATQLFKDAKQIGLVGSDSVWILAESVSCLLDSVDTSVLSSMQGALGIKTYFSENSRPFLDFKASFRQTFKLDHPEEDKLDVGIHALRAYDSVATISQAVVKLGSSNATAKVLLNEILASNFSGLSGDIWFRDGKLSDSPIFGIINIVGKSYKELGFWSSKYGFSDNHITVKGDISMKALNSLVNWPGDLHREPKGWSMPTIKKPMKIGVPGATSFEKFVKVVHHGSSDEPVGFCIDVFKAALVYLEKMQGYTLPYEFFPYYNGSYDELIEHVYNKTYDAVVGDVTILANRVKLVEFTQPFVESGLSMLVPVKSEPQEGWKFMKPFSNEMWVATFAILFYTTFVVWFMEHQTNQEFRGPWKDQLGTALWFTFSSLFYAHREKIQSNYSKTVVTMWLFFVFILTSSYTASLTSMLTVRRLEPTVPNIEWLRRTNATVGFDPDSFVGKYLKDVLLLRNIKNISSQDEYPEKFRSGDIQAAFLELPYLKVFLNEYYNQYTASGPIYRFGGQGFVFQKGSPIANDVSEAILALLESGELQVLENKWFNSSLSFSNIAPEIESERLSLNSFSGIYIISGVTSTICFLLFLLRLLRKQLRQLEPASRWSKAFRLLQIVLRLNDRRKASPSTNDWESVSPTEIPEHMEIALRPTAIEIPVRTA